MVNICIQARNLSFSKFACIFQRPWVFASNIIQFYVFLFILLYYYFYFFVPSVLFNNEEILKNTLYSKLLPREKKNTVSRKSGILHTLHD